MIATEFDFGSSISYREYVATSRSIRRGEARIANERRGLIGTSEQFAAIGVLVEASTSDWQSHDRVRLRPAGEFRDDGSLSRSILSGVHSVLVSFGTVSDDIHKLVANSKSPAQTWPLNHFAVAREALERGLYREALQSIDYAIHGNSDHVGYSLDHRFHHLLGVLRLGLVGDPDSAGVIDLAHSETAFLTAARCAYTGRDKALSLVGAGIAMHYAGNARLAEAHFERALSHDSCFGEALYQSARLSMLNEDLLQAMQLLERAILSDAAYALRASFDPIFSSWQPEVEHVVRSAIREHASRSQELLDDLVRSYTWLSTPPAPELRWPPIEAETTRLQDSQRELRGNLQSNLTLLGAATLFRDVARQRAISSRLLQSYVAYISPQRPEGWSTPAFLMAKKWEDDINCQQRRLALWSLLWTLCIGGACATLLYRSLPSAGALAAILTVVLALGLREFICRGVTSQQFSQAVASFEPEVRQWTSQVSALLSGRIPYVLTIGSKAASTSIIK